MSKYFYVIFLVLALCLNIAWAGDVEYLIMKATNEVRNEIEIVQTQQQIINSQNAANLIRQGGALLNPQSNIITCYHAPGTPFATCSNQ